MPTEAEPARDAPAHDDPAAADGRIELPPITFRAIAFGSGPRFTRDAFGPVLVFYVVWKLVGIVPGILAATAVALAAVYYERKRDRAGLVVRIALALVLVQAVVGIVTRSAEIYLIQPVIVSGIYGLAFLVSPALGRPLTAVFASELYPFPLEVRESESFRRIFSRLSYAWGVYQLVRSTLKAAVLIGLGVDLYVVVNFLTGAPMIAGMMSWSIWYTVRSFRRSEEWGWAIAALDAGTLPPSAEPSEA
ncbi:MAG TPA: VC0807 family protein [Acidimicrobiia bacterium]